MIRRTLARGILVLCGLSVGGSVVGAEGSLSAVSIEPRRVRVGEPYPDFELPRISDRAPTRLSQFRGKKVLLIQFASW